MIILKCCKTGNSLMLSIPKRFAAEMNIDRSTYFTLTAKDANTLVYSKVAPETPPKRKRHIKKG